MDAIDRSLEVRESHCSATERRTKSLIGYGILAPPLYVVVWLAQAATRDGFNPRQHAASLLANGEHGWIQIANFIVVGVMLLAAAIGIRRLGVGHRKVGVLIGVFGAGMIGAGLFSADPAYGFPAGAAVGQPLAISVHAALHLAFGSIGFLALIIATFVAARQLARSGARLAAVASVVAGATFLAANLSGGALVESHPSLYNVVLTLGIVAGLTWLTGYCVHAYGIAAGRPS
jgi:hypothetical membrane protein